jgi:hypothetical protein
MAPYNFNQHKHNYATWTSARAVQRGFTTTSRIKKAIESSRLRQYSEGLLDNSFIDFDTFHRICSNQIIKSFEEQGLGKVTYGRVAKIISIYLKTTVILCNQGNCERSKIIHPPIDNILLVNMSKLEGLSSLKKIRWTQLDENEYWDLIAKLKSHFKVVDWTLEEFWTPELSD